MVGIHMVQLLANQFSSSYNNYISTNYGLDNYHEPFSLITRWIDICKDHTYNRFIALDLLILLIEVEYSTKVIIFNNYLKYIIKNRLYTIDLNNNLFKQLRWMRDE